MGQDPVIKKIIIRTIGFNVFLLGLWYFFIDQPGPWVKGTILGTLLALLMFRQMKFTLEKALVKSPNRAASQVRRGYLIRYVIYFVVFGLSFLSEDINVFTVILSVVSIKYIVLVSGVFDKKFFKD